MRYLFKTNDHPAANGRQPIAGEQSFVAYFPTEEEGRVTVIMGRRGFVNHMAAVLALLSDDPELSREIAEASMLVQTSPPSEQK